MIRISGRSTVAPRGGKMGGWTGRGGGRTREPTGRVGGQTGDQDGQGGDRGNRANGGVGKAPDFATAIAQQLQDLLPTIVSQGDVRNVNMNNNQGGGTYKEFLACNPKDYDGKGDAIVFTHWIEKMESVQTRGREAAFGLTWKDFKALMREELCPNNEMQKLETEFWCHVMVGTGHVAYTDRFHELARLFPHLVTPESKRIEKYIYGLAPQIRRMKRGNDREPSRDGNVRDDNKRSRTGKAFATTTNPARREYTGVAPKCTTCNFHHHPEIPCRTCMNCNRLRHFAKDSRVGSKMVNPLNARNPIATHGACFECGGTDHYKAACPRLNRAPGQRGNRPNQAMDIEGGQGHGNNGNSTWGEISILVPIIALFPLLSYIC
ncbi:reverse transcriptase domain-containing protein [Tanacetum coccineum]